MCGPCDMDHIFSGPRAKKTLCGEPVTSTLWPAEPLGSTILFTAGQKLCPNCLRIAKRKKGEKAK
jgi:hypothetical protein